MFLDVFDFLTGDPGVDEVQKALNDAQHSGEHFDFERIHEITTVLIIFNRLFNANDKRLIIKLTTES